MSGFRDDIIQLHPFRIRDARIEHLILRRSDTDALCPGVWQVITGAMSADEMPEEAALRELAEETQLRPTRLYRTGITASFFFEPFDSTVRSPVFACELMADAEPKLSDEHSDFRWCVKDAALRLLTFNSHRDALTAVEALIASGFRDVDPLNHRVS